MRRRDFVAGALASASAPACAQTFPSRPIKLIVPYVAGSPVDVLARVLMQDVSQRLGVGVIVENRAGAGTSIGTKAVATAPPDGYTLLLSGQTLAYINLFYPELDLHPIKSFSPIALVAEWSHVFIVRKELPVTTLADFVALAKARPGKLSFGFGLSTSPQIVGEYFKAIAGLDILSVPYRGGEQARLDLLGGQIDMNVVPLSNVVSMVQENSVRALAITHRKREALLPDVPTMAESGYPQLGFDPDVWLAIFSAPGTPEAVVNVLHAKINESLASREMRAAYERLGIGMRSGTIEDLTTLLTAHMGKWPEILRLANVQPPT